MSLHENDNRSHNKEAECPCKQIQEVSRSIEFLKKFDTVCVRENQNDYGNDEKAVLREVRWIDCNGYFPKLMFWQHRNFIKRFFVCKVMTQILPNLIKTQVTSFKSCFRGWLLVRRKKIIISPRFKRKGIDNFFRPIWIQLMELRSWKLLRILQALTTESFPAVTGNWRAKARERG